MNLAAIFHRHNITPRGVIHAGAHEGQECAEYARMGFGEAILIEANPHVIARLCERIRAVVGEGMPAAECVQCAVGEYDGSSVLRVTSYDESSSLLPLKEHLRVHPGIVEVEQIPVQVRRIDTLIAEMGKNPADYNFLCIDVQGSELNVLRGATETLRYLDAVQAEISFSEMYAGSAPPYAILLFMEQQGFAVAGMHVRTDEQADILWMKR